MSDKKQLKILILMAYYNRPILVRNALKSIVEANEYHQNWHLFFGDDGSSIPGKPIVQEILGELTKKVTFVESNLTLEQKLQQGLSIGKYANQAIRDSDADISLILCDDDELVPTYLFNLNDYFLTHSDVLYCYSKVYIYNPILNKNKEVNNGFCKYNKFNESINPVNNLDASQVAWRLECCKKYGAWFAESTKRIEDKPLTSDTDRAFFENLFNKCGLCKPTNFFSQYKGIHDYQLLWHKNAPLDSIKAYDQMCRELAGNKF
jgi:hypothetical protein